MVGKTCVVSICSVFSTLQNVELNKESLGELAPERKEYFGTGLYIWQNPKQFTKYVLWLLKNAGDCKSYVEIGSR